MAGLDDFSGSYNDKLYQYLGSKGFTGTLNDRLEAFTGYSGNVGEKLTAFYLGLVPFGPDAPTNLVTSGITISAITLSGDAVTGADHYEVYLDDVLVDDTVEAESFQFTGLTQSTEYELGVIAVDANDNKSTMATLTQTTATPDEANVVNKTTDYEILSGDSGNIFTNEGAGGEINLTLPSCEAGLYYTFVCKNTHKLDVLLGASDKIINVGTSTEYTGGASAQVFGRSMTLIGIDDTYWVLSDQNGFTIYN